MSDLPYSINIIFEQQKSKEYFQVGVPVKGKLVLKANENLYVSELGYEVFLKFNGRTKPGKLPIAQKNLVKGQSFKVGEIKTYEFEFVNSDYRSYEGQNISQLVMFKPVLKLGYKLRDAFTSLLINDYEKTDLYPLEFKEIGSNIRIEDVCLKFQSSAFRALMEFFPLLFMLILIGLVAVFISHDLSLQLFSQIVGIFGLLWLIYFILEYEVVGNLSVELKDIQNKGFSIRLARQKGRKGAKFIKASIEAIESVEDNRGKHGATHREVVYAFEILEEELLNNEIQDEFAYPPLEFASFVQVNARIYWQINVMVYTKFFTSYVFREKFTMKLVA